MEEFTMTDNLSWWREARFGMFIHWGLYAVPAGTWKGEKIPGIGEWIMKRAEIPVAQYEPLANDFNPTEFNADEWMSLASEAGMKYLVITAKHHDGFAMYKSDCCDYNIVDRTPWGKDPMKDLAAACKKYDIKLCFYYSQAQDWNHPNGIGNDWDFKPEDEKDFDQYLDEKCIPQLKELLTNYGPIGLIWFDTPMSIKIEQSQRLADYVHSIQPECLVSGRIGHGVCDYKSMGDNQIPFLPVDDDWETPATLNDTWGFKDYDHNWKEAKTLIHWMVNINSKNGNYLLNVGPTKEGIIPKPSVDILKKVGAWMKVNSDSIYGTGSAPVFAYEMDGIKATHKPGKLFIHLFEYPEPHGHMGRGVMIRNFKIDAKKVYLMSDKETELENHCIYRESNGHHMFGFKLPEECPDAIDTVICVEYEGEFTVEPF